MVLLYHWLFIILNSCCIFVSCCHLSWTYLWGRQDTNLLSQMFQCWSESTECVLHATAFSVHALSIPDKSLLTIPKAQRTCIYRSLFCPLDPRSKHLGGILSGLVLYTDVEKIIFFNLIWMCMFCTESHFLLPLQWRLDLMLKRKRMLFRPAPILENFVSN